MLKNVGKVVSCAQIIILNITHQCTDLHLVRNCQLISLKIDLIFRVIKRCNDIHVMNNYNSNSKGKNLCSTDICL